MVLSARQRKVSHSKLQKFDDGKINVMEWLSHNPGISLIENVWKMLKYRIYDGEALKSKAKLWESINNAILEKNTINVP